LIAIVKQPFGESFPDRLFEFAMTNKSDFVKSGVGTSGNYNPEYRNSVYLRDCAEVYDWLKPILDARRAEFARATGVLLDGTLEHEIELVSHGDGAYFRRHIDTFTGAVRSVESERILSAVYYFHREPRRFSGGRLRFFPLRASAPPDAVADVVEPERDTLALFASWLPHEVEQVHCGSSEFADSRLSLNIWFRRLRES
jgi:SM-20-related protein